MITIAEAKSKSIAGRREHLKALYKRIDWAVGYRKYTVFLLRAACFERFYNLESSVTALVVKNDIYHGERIESFESIETLNELCILYLAAFHQLARSESRVIKETMSNDAGVQALEKAEALLEQYIKAVSMKH